MSCLSGTRRERPRRMLKKARLLTRPTLARRDAPSPKQGRSSEADPRFTFHVSRLTFHGSRERSENDAGGLFQHPARLSALIRDSQSKGKSSRLRENYFCTRALRWSARVAPQKNTPADCSNRLSGKAAASEGPKAYPLGRTVRRIRSTKSVRAAEW